MKAVADICNISTSQAAQLTNATLSKVREVLEPALPKIIGEYISTYTSLEFEMQFQIPEYEDWQIEVMKTDRPKGLYARRKWKKKLIEMQKPKTFVIMDELANEPAQLWTQLQDNYVKKIAALKEDEPWKAWQYFPEILARCAWQPGESRFTKNVAGDVVVDFERINRMRQAFMSLPAETAIKAVTFFLTINELYLKDPHSGSLIKKLATLSSSQLRPVKNTLSDGAISDILKTYLRTGMK